PQTVDVVPRTRAVDCGTCGIGLYQRFCDIAYIDYAIGDVVPGVWIKRAVVMVVFGFVMVLMLMFMFMAMVMLVLVVFVRMVIFMSMVMPMSRCRYGIDTAAGDQHLAIVA